MNLRELLKSDTMAAIKKSGRVSKSKLDEGQFKDYVASKDELEKELEQAKKSMALYRQQGNAPMAAKAENQIKQLEAKLKK